MGLESVIVWQGDLLAAGWALKPDVDPLLEANSVVVVAAGRPHVLLRVSDLGLLVYSAHTCVEAGFWVASLSHSCRLILRRIRRLRAEWDVGSLACGIHLYLRVRVAHLGTGTTDLSG